MTTDGFCCNERFLRLLLLCWNRIHLRGFTICYSITLVTAFKAPWCSGYHYCTTWFNKAWTQVQRKFKSCLWSVGDSRWWGSLAIVPAGNKAKRLSSVNHTTKNNSSSFRNVDLAGHLTKFQAAVLLAPTERYELLFELLRGCLVLPRSSYSYLSGACSFISFPSFNGHFKILVCDENHFSWLASC